MEVGFGVLFVIYAINYLVGSQKNHKIIENWYTLFIHKYFCMHHFEYQHNFFKRKSNFIPLYRENFQLVGYGKSLVVEEAPNRFSLKSTGRINCRGSHTDIMVHSFCTG